MLEPHGCWCPRPSQLWDMQGPAWGSPDTGTTALPPLLCPRHGWAEPGSFQGQHRRCHPARPLSARKGLWDQEQLSRRRERGGQSCWEVLRPRRCFACVRHRDARHGHVWAWAAGVSPWGRAENPESRGRPSLPAQSAGQSDCPGSQQQLHASPSPAGPPFPPGRAPRVFLSSPSPSPCPLPALPEAGAAPGPPGRPHLLAPEPGAILILILQTQTALPGQIRAALTSPGGGSRLLLRPFPGPGSEPGARLGHRRESKEKVLA